MTQASPRAAAFACLGLAMSLTGTYVALSKPLALVFPVFLLAWLRYGLGAVAMLGWLRKPVDEPPLAARDKALLFLNALLGSFLFTILMIYGVSLTQATTAGVVMASIPAWVALLSWGFLRERIGTRTWMAIACAVVGIILFSLNKHAPLATPGSAASPQPHGAWGEELGIVLLLGASCCEGAYSVIGKRLTAALGPRRISALINLWGFMLATPIGLYLAFDFDFRSVHWRMWALLLFYALAACMWTVWLWMTGLARIPASQAGVFTVMLPVSAALVGAAFLGETMNAAQFLAFGLALTSVVLATLPERGFRRARRGR